MRFKKAFWVLLQLVVLAFLTAPTQALDAGRETYPNPLIKNRADPWAMRHDDGYYYFTATVPEYDRIELRRSRTVLGLREAEPKVIWNKRQQGPMSYHIWAPEIHFVDGKWYVYFAAAKAEAIWDIRIYVLENASPNRNRSGDSKAFTDRGRVRT